MTASNLVTTALRDSIPSYSGGSILNKIGVHSATLPKPLASRLDVYRLVASSDEVVVECINKLLDAVDNSIVYQHTHPNPEIAKFVNDNIAIAFDNFGFDYYKTLRDFIYTTLWAGFAVGETNIQGDDLAVGLTGVDVYEPNSIYIVPDKQGRLTDGEPVGYSPLPVYNSGIYQTSPYFFDGMLPTFALPGVNKIPIYKRVYAAREALYGNYYGNSILEAAYKWHIIKEALIEILISSSDQHGHPRAVFIIPNGNSGVQEFDHTGTPRTLSTLEYLTRQVEANNNSENFHDPNKGLYYLPYVDPTLKPEVKVLSPGVSVSKDILDTIKFCQDNQRLSILKSLGIDIKDPHTTINTIHAIHKHIIKPYISQIWKYVILHNFPNTSYSTASVNLPLRSSLKPEDNVSLMQMVVGLTNVGIINPLAEEDWTFIRSKIDMQEREMTSEDKEVILARILKGSKKSGSGTSDPVISRTLESEIAGGSTQANEIRGDARAPSTNVTVS